MGLSDVQSGRKMKPLAIILYGVEGVGKTFFGMSSPNPINLGAEPNEEIDGARFPVCKTYDGYIKRLDELLNENHDYKTLVVDTLDSVEALLHKQIVENDGKAQSINTANGGYGKGHAEADKHLINMRDDKFQALREKRGMNIVLLNHSTKVKVEDPMTPDTSYDSYQLKLHVNQKGVGALPIFTEWVSAVLFANHRIASTEKDGKRYVMGAGERVMYTEKRPGYFGKNRFNLPHEMPLSWIDFANGVKSFYNGVQPVTPEPAQGRVSASHDPSRECVDYVTPILGKESLDKFIAYTQNNYQNFEIITTLKETIGILKKRGDNEFTKKVIDYISDKCGTSHDNLLTIKAKAAKAAGV